MVIWRKWAGSDGVSKGELPLSRTKALWEDREGEEWVSYLRGWEWFEWGWTVEERG